MLFNLLFLLQFQLIKMSTIRSKTNPRVVNRPPPEPEYDVGVITESVHYVDIDSSQMIAPVSEVGVTIHLSLTLDIHHILG